MEIQVLFDSKSQDNKFKIGWGLSFLVDRQIIFDTGENCDWLIDNMINLKIDINKIKAVVISHDHWDHTGGLWELLKKKEGLIVFGCPNFSHKFKLKVKKLKGNIKTVAEPTEIAKNIYVSGQITGEYGSKFIAEQSLIIKTDNGITALTGCAHPGIIKILQVIKKMFPKENFYLVAGGFHLIDKPIQISEFIVEQFKALKVKLVGPTHCTGDDVVTLFRKEYNDKFIELKVGKTFEV